MRKLSHRSAHKTANQLVRYFFVGGTAAVVDIGAFAFFSQALLIDYRIAVVFAFSFGVLANFSLCNWLVFRGKLSPLWLVFVRHYLSSISGLVANEIVMITLVEGFQFERLILAKVIGTGVAFFFNFAIKKFYVYNDAFYKRSRNRQASIKTQRTKRRT